MLTDQKTITAIATPSGCGGIGVIRISGNKAKQAAQTILKQKKLTPRKVYYSSFHTEDDQVIDQGIALFFKAPYSFTGEDVLELHGHGGVIILDRLLKRVLQIEDIRLAEPGEFSKRAFLNGKIDLTQAEAIVDLINASSEKATQSAIRSLQGEFSNKILMLVDTLIHLRMFVEASIDFPEEEIDFLSDSKVVDDLTKLINQLNNIEKIANQGSLLREGLTVVIAGKPNAGKSSLLNALSGRDSAIVTDIPGTTRDILREYIHVDGLPLHIIDTAGLQKSTDKIEQEGIRRAWSEIKKADQILLVVDSNVEKVKTLEKTYVELLKASKNIPIIIIKNKIDLTKEKPQIKQLNDRTIISLSAKTKQGLDLLKEHLKESVGFKSNAEGLFMARRRHLNALKRAKASLHAGKKQLLENNAGELLAEELRQAQNALSEITGEFTTDDLLGKIFSEFCLGK